MLHGIRQAASELIDGEANFSDAVDQAAADIDRSFALQLQNREREQLFQIDEALKRIDAGTYGTCERCEESILDARLAAFPFTTLCLDCKAELESESNRYPGRAS